MDASPLSAPATPRSSSPSPFDVSLNAPASPSSEHAKTLADVGDAEGDDHGVPETGVTNPPDPAPRDTTINKLLKGKEKARKGPLRLLDLPVDILKEIIHQLPHTNDLTSLALCHSALHRLTIPCIYSRFDIVWPDESTHTEPRTGVDALTYGLATLVMGDDGFPHQARQRHWDNSSASPAPRSNNRSAATPYPIARRRFGNYYAQFTKKFSLGNGPAAWVQEYMIAKEGGKMLGTLVALAVARMINLETFVWDMPTGVLRDVWLALSSLADRTDGDECRLDRLWIRWHDNTIDAPTPPPAPPMILNNVPAPPGTTHPSGVGAVQAPVVVPAHYSANIPAAIDRVEHPTFSVIPALKSLSVLDIDELPYLDEMSILIARSQRKLRELRVGIAPHAQQRDWVTAWEGDGIQQVDYSSASTAGSSISEKRLGGVLGILVGRVHNMRQTEETPGRTAKVSEVGARPTDATSGKLEASGALPVVAPLHVQHDRDSDLPEHHPESVAESGTAQEGVSLIGENQPAIPDHVAHVGSNTPALESNHFAHKPLPYRTSKIAGHGDSDAVTGKASKPSEPVLNGTLRLEVLELERVPLSVPVLLKAFDWTLLSTLTLLHCNNHEQLWKSLRRTYTPRSPYPAGSPSSSSKAYKASYTLRTEYGLSLKKVHTNTVSPALISFLKETLAPNTLEVLFLQEGRSYSSTVTVDAIYRGPLRRHRGSLKKLMIDSSEKGPDGHATTSSRWRRWMLNREIITFITSGRMNSLRELAVSIDYKDWHHFLQRLPLIPHIRSLYIPFIADHAHGNNIDPRELAMQILDIVHLRPEIEICYMGISTKCFEILENRPSNYDLRHDSTNEADAPTAGLGGGYTAHDPLMSDDESEATEDEEEDEFDGGVTPAADGDESGSDISDEAHEDSDDDSFLQDDRKVPRLRIREILFYEEKIETLRARHGTLKP
ncbi:F-box domain-containing protein [Lophiostoma macrostomum CBS 122681]|uniref:F-box domain-containing protein n=1 Tax=Lophiostoma macrostomum CBS 122681 TaxID=1314788 RepID=A0A6A6TDH5_9PLEO|nr:F-box domain-containing protein [Lophiostoma macrostomum CBS 122681]